MELKEGEVVRGRPIPPARNGKAQEAKYPFQDLREGDSFDVLAPGRTSLACTVTTNRLRASWSRFVERNPRMVKYRLTVRVAPDNSGIRVWMVRKAEVSQ